MKKKRETAHYTQDKASRTLALLKRSLKILIESDEPITLNKHEYKKINFSLGQVINAIKETALPQEEIDGIIITSPSTLSKSDPYQAEIAAAKTKRADRLRSTDKTRIDVQYGDNDMLTVTKLRTDIGLLMADKKSLMDENRALKNIMKQAEIEVLLEGDGPIEKVNENTSLDEKLVKILEKLLVHGSKTMDIMIETQKGGKSAKIILQDVVDGSMHLCYVDDLAGLNIKFEKDGERVTIKKGVTHGLH